MSFVENDLNGVIGLASAMPRLKQEQGRRPSFVSFSFQFDDLVWMNTQRKFFLDLNTALGFSKIEPWPQDVKEASAWATGLGDTHKANGWTRGASPASPKRASVFVSFHHEATNTLFSFTHYKDLFNTSMPVGPGSLTAVTEVGVKLVLWHLGLMMAARVD
ncbi:MAG: hypothetical protein GC129_00515 [Proteobacteria bacterium]|nr:hypothetical protein [Pseudomonadota bacterium]